MEHAIAFLGWSGVVALLAAYAIASSGRRPITDVKLQSANIYAGAALCINAGFNGAFPSATTNAIWALIGLVSLVRAVKKTLRR